MPLPESARGFKPVDVLENHTHRDGHHAFKDRLCATSIAPEGT
jgi:hypothetical protein